MLYSGIFLVCCFRGFSTFGVNLPWEAMDTFTRETPCVEQRWLKSMQLSINDGTDFQMVHHGLVPPLKTPGGNKRVGPGYPAMSKVSTSRLGPGIRVSQNLTNALVLYSVKFPLCPLSLPGLFAAQIEATGVCHLLV